MMSLAATCWWTLVRTVVLCLVAWPACRLIERSFRQLSSNWRPWFLAGLLAPCCFPELLVGYAFRDIALAEPKWAEGICGGLLLVRIIPIGAIALLVAPRSALDSAALHCRRILRRSATGSFRNWLEEVRCYWHGPIIRAVPALTLMGLVAFQEFELAALLQTMSWTDWFVTHQQLGLDRSELLRQTLWPLLWQTPVLIGALFWLRTKPDEQVGFTSVSDDAHSGANRRVIGIGVSCIAMSLIVGCLIPLGLIGWRTMDGLTLLLRHKPQQVGLAREIATSGAIAICAGVSAWGLSGRLTGATVYGLLPGLLGSLLLSLGCVTLFQVSWLRAIYDTPVPWVLALTAWLLPRAAILRLWLRAFRREDSIHVASMLGGVSRTEGHILRRPSRLLWHLRDQPQFLAVSLLCYWAYCDLPSAHLLAPTGMASGLVRLYNFMHFGRSAALSAEASVFFGVPVVSLFLLLLANRRFR